MAILIRTFLPRTDRYRMNLPVLFQCTEWYCSRHFHLFLCDPSSLWKLEPAEVPVLPGTFCLACVRPTSTVTSFAGVFLVNTQAWFNPCSFSTSFPGSFPYLECGAGKDPGIGLSRATLHPEILGVINYRGLHNQKYQNQDDGETVFAKSTWIWF